MIFSDRLQFAIRIANALRFACRWHPADEVAQCNFEAEAQQVTDALALQGLFRQDVIELE